MSQELSNSGYYRVHLATIKPMKQKHYSVHRLVALMFVENDDPINKIQVNHKNGNKTKNIASNLEWLSQSENVLHAYRTGLCSIKGTNSHLSSKEYTDEIVHSIAKLLEEGLSSYEIILTLRLVEQLFKRSDKKYQKWRRYIKGLRHRDCRNDILSQYNF